MHIIKKVVKMVIVAGINYKYYWIVVFSSSQKKSNTIIYILELE